MKTLFSVIACAAFFIIQPVAAQQKVEYMEVKNLNFKEFEAAERFKFPLFKKADIHLKGGEVASARINYDYFMNDLRYISGKDTLSLANASDVLFIVAGTDSIFWDKQYYEWVASTSKTRLLKTINFKYKGEDVVGAYGTSTRNFSTNKVESLQDNLQKGLALNTTLNLEKTTTYYLSLKNGKVVKATKGNIEDLFPKKDVEDFVKEKKLNLNKIEDLIVLFAYVNSAELR